MDDWENIGNYTMPRDLYCVTREFKQNPQGWVSWRTGQLTLPHQIPNSSCRIPGTNIWMSKSVFSCEWQWLPRPLRFVARASHLEMCQIVQKQEVNTYLGHQLETTPDSQTCLGQSAIYGPRLKIVQWKWPSGHLTTSGFSMYGLSGVNTTSKHLWYNW